jgi:hypothetical protein
MLRVKKEDAGPGSRVSSATDDKGASALTAFTDRLARDGAMVFGAANGEGTGNRTDYG